jgi:hypothetical protein
LAGVEIAAKGKANTMAVTIEVMNVFMVNT